MVLVYFLTQAIFHYCIFLDLPSLCRNVTTQPGDCALIQIRHCGYKLPNRGFASSQLYQALPITVERYFYKV
jgi:hypothetical protein